MSEEGGTGSAALWTRKRPHKRKRRSSSEEGGGGGEPPAAGEKDDDTMCTPALKAKMMDLIQNMMRKDVHMIFAEPVSDRIAPNYSTIITQPMDLSTMQAKVQQGEYCSLRELKTDADLMCRNCMVYNADDTIFYREGVKLQNYIHTLFGEKKSKPGMSTEVREGIRKKNELQEEWDAQEIAKSVKLAAQKARDKLHRLAPATRVGYLTKNEDDTVILNIINAPSGEPTEKVVDLSPLDPIPNTATCLLANFREKKRQPNKAVSYLHYGPFGSFMPAFDSAYSSLDRSEQQLLHSCYGNELGLSYCRSVQEFARGAADSLRQPVDNIINSLTGGGHARANKILAQKYAKIIREKRMLRARRLAAANGNQAPPTPTTTGENSAMETSVSMETELAPGEDQGIAKTTPESTSENSDENSAAAEIAEEGKPPTEKSSEEVGEKSSEEVGEKSSGEVGETKAAEKMETESRSSEGKVEESESKTENKVVVQSERKMEEESETKTAEIENKVQETGSKKAETENKAADTENKVEETEKKAAVATEKKTAVNPETSETPTESKVESTPDITTESTPDVTAEQLEEKSLLALLESDTIPDILGEAGLQERLERACGDAPLARKLEENRTLIGELERRQGERLSGRRVSGESELAGRVRSNLTEMIGSHGTPADVVSQEAVRGTMASELVEQL